MMLSAEKIQHLKDKEAKNINIEEIEETNGEIKDLGEVETKEAKWKRWRKAK